MNTILLLLTSFIIKTIFSIQLREQEFITNSKLVDNKCCWKDFKVRISEIYTTDTVQNRQSNTPDWIRYNPVGASARAGSYSYTTSSYTKINNELGTFTHDCERTADYCNTADGYEQLEGGLIHHSVNGVTGQVGPSKVKCAYGYPFDNKWDGMPGMILSTDKVTEMKREIGCLIKDSDKYDDMHCWGYLNNERCEEDGHPCYIILTACGAGLNIGYDRWAYVSEFIGAGGLVGTPSPTAAPTTPAPSRSPTQSPTMYEPVVIPPIPAHLTAWYCQFPYMQTNPSCIYISPGYVWWYCSNPQFQQNPACQ